MMVVKKNNSDYPYLHLLAAIKTVMNRINKKEIIKAKRTLALAMFNDELHEYFFPEKNSRIKKLELLYDYKLKTQLASTYRTSENLEGICIWEEASEHGNRFSFKEITHGLALAFKVGISNLIKMLKYEIWANKLKNEMVTAPYCYLDTVVVSPDHQGKGYASKMIKPLLMQALKKGEKVYLETHNIKNIPIYERYGFKLESSRKYNDQITHYIMIAK